MSNRYLYGSALAACLLMEASGCDGGTDTYPVHGIVTYDGKKVPTGWVTLVREGNGGSIHSEIGEDGTYGLVAEPGMYLVGISAPRQFPPGTKPEDTFKMNLPPPYVPPAYNIAERSGLKVTVEEKENVIDFPLKPIGAAVARSRP